MRQLAKDLRAHRPLGPSLAGWWHREGRGVLVGAALVVLGWIGYQQVQIGALGRRQCQQIHALAELGRRSLGEEKQETKEFEAQSSDRLGLTQTKFEALVTKKQAREAHKQVVLDRVARSSCG